MLSAFLRIQKLLIQLIDYHVNCNVALTFHLHDGCFKDSIANRLVNPNRWIENVSYIIMISHLKCKCFHTIIEVNNSILCDCGRIVFDHIWKHLEMLTLVITLWIWIHHIKFVWQIFIVARKSHMNTSPPCANLIKAFTAFSNGIK
jgi:hypothetical protein